MANHEYFKYAIGELWLWYFGALQINGGMKIGFDQIG
jgi:hypothetical protein